MLERSHVTKLFEGVPWLLASGVDVEGWDQVAPSVLFETGHVSGFAGCNFYSGSYAVDGTTLELGEITSTRMACPNPAAAVERAYFAALKRVTAWHSQNAELALLAADEVELLRYRAATPVGAWRATGLLQGDGFTTLLAGTEITASFDESGRLSGSAGCNTYNAGYSTDRGEIKISEPVTTRKLCHEPGGIMEQEAAYLAALQSAARYAIRGRSLELLSAEGTNVVTYTHDAADTGSEEPEGSAEEEPEEPIDEEEPIEEEEPTHEVAPSVTGPTEPASRADSAPYFRVDSGTNPYYIFEITSDAGLFDADRADERSGSTWYSSWGDPDAPVRLEGEIYWLPEPAWEHLRGNDRLWFRIGTTPAEDSWDGYVVSTADDDGDNAPSFRILSSDRGGGTRSRATRSGGAGTAAPAPLLATFKVINKIHEADPVNGVTVLVGGQSTTNNTGNRISRDLAGVPDGDLFVLVTPHDLYTIQSHSSIGDPATNPPDRLWSPYVATIIKQGTTFSSSDPRVTIMNKDITIRLMPKWMRIASGRTRGTQTPTLIVVHHTDDENPAYRRQPPGPYDPNFHSKINRSINAWIANNFAPHYVIDRDGSVVKLGHESLQAFHADPARWDGRSPVNEFSIGIEVIHTNNAASNGQPTYTEQFEQAQYDSLIALLEDLTSTFNIDRSSIVGHSDVATNVRTANAVVGRKSTDPGIQFDWTVLEAAGLGLQRDQAPVDFTVAYGGFFDATPTGRIRAGAAGVTQGIITELKNDLTLIGYQVRSGATYDDSLKKCVMVFCEHFLHRDSEESVSRDMAEALKRVVAFLAP
jgi:N-acetyl-anhydromuramyl-L-alanine amidase AmpD/heat shock protein HslJ